MLLGYTKGVADAQLAQAQIVAAGLPLDSVVYATADFDVTAAEFNVCDNYLAGFASVLGKNRVGIYGGIYYLNHVHAVGLAVAFWVCASTSFAHGQAAKFPIHLQQTVNTPPVAGSDHDYIYDTTSLAGAGIPTKILDALEKNKMLLLTSVEKRSPLLIGPLGCINIVDQGEVDALKGSVGAAQTNDLQMQQIQNAVVRYAANARAYLTGSAPTAAPAVDVKALATALAAALPQGQPATAAQIAAELVKHIS
jgi:hypothetical protein